MRRFLTWLAVKPPEVTPAGDLWALQRVGAILGMLLGCGVLASVLIALGVSDGVTVVGFLATFALCVLYAGWVIKKMAGHERRRQQLLTAMRHGEPLDQALRALTDPPSQPLRRRATLWGVSLIGAPIVAGTGCLLVGISGHHSAIRTVGIVLVSLDVIVAAIALPALSAWASDRRNR